MQTLLDLGASPDVKDALDLTPLYYSVCNEDAAQECTHMLLHERARIGMCDANGWYEIHQVGAVLNKLFGLTHPLNNIV